MCAFKKKKAPKVAKADDTIAEREAAAKAAADAAALELSKANSRRKLNSPLGTEGQEL